MDELSSRSGHDADGRSGKPGTGPVDAPPEAGPEPTSDAVAGPWGPALDRLPTLLFGVFVLVAGPLVLFHYGAYHWFFRDDFEFLTNSGGTFPPVFEPHGGPHWVALPRIVYAVLWRIVGLTSYVPYQAWVVALHLSCVVLLRAVMRRADVGPWLASAAAAVLVLFGPGAENIVWAFQISFTGALALGLVALLLTGHDGPIGRRDLGGLLFGLAAVMTSGVGVTMAAVVALAILLRRGWRPALAYTAPLALVYGAWAVLADASTDGQAGRPTVGTLVRWVESAQIGTFLGLGHFQAVAILLTVILVVGVGLALGPLRLESAADARRRLAAPVALFLGGILFSVTTGLGRWQIGAEGARGSRYVYLGAACTLPLLAVAAQELARRRPPATLLLVGLLLLPIPFNLGGFTPEVFGVNYMERRERVLTTAVRMPFARDVPPDVQPIPDPFASDAVNMGFLLSAEERGDLNPSTTPITDATIAEFRVRLGVAARPARSEEVDIDQCAPIRRPEPWQPELGTRVVVTGPVEIAARGDGGRFGPPVTFEPSPALNELTIELPDLDLEVRPAGPDPAALCALP